MIVTVFPVLVLSVRYVTSYFGMVNYSALVSDINENNVVFQ